MNDPAAGTDPQTRALQITASRSGMLFRGCVWRLIHLVLYPWFRVRRRGAAYLDTPGPLIVAPVHRSNLDSLLVAGMTGRMMYALGKESLFRPPALGWVMSALGAFPVDRGAADRDALRAAQMLLERSELVIVFPEGTRQSGTEVGEIFDGAAFLAARTGAKVVPIGIAGTERALPPGAKFPRRTRVAVVVGAPLEPPTSDTGRVTRNQRRSFTAELSAALQAAFDEAGAEAEAI